MKRIAVVGCGYWGRHYTRLFSNLNGCQLVAVLDQRAELAGRAAASYPGVKPFTDIESLLSAAELDAAVVATPATTHYAITRRLLEADLDVLVEKPLASSFSEACRLQVLAAERERIMMMGHTFLFHSAVRQMKSLIERGAIGRVYFANARRAHLGLIREDVTATWDLAPHDISICRYLFGPNAQVLSATVGDYLRQGRSDVAFFQLGFDGGISANVYVSWLAPGRQRIFEVVGSHGQLTFDDTNTREPLRLHLHGAEGPSPWRARYPDPAPTDIVIPVEPAEPLATVARHFVACIQNRTRPEADGDDGAAIVGLLEEIERKARSV